MSKESNPQDPGIITSEEEKNSVLKFAILAYAISWISFFFQQYTENNEILFFINERITKFGPTISGLILIYYISQKDGLRDIWRRSTNLNLYWITVGVLGALIINLVAFIFLLLSGENPELVFMIPETIIGIFYWLFLRIVLGGGLGEEIGFRGFALPRLQLRFGPRLASLFVGLIWTFWHAPGWFASGSPIVNMVVQLIFTVSLSFIFTYLYNKSNGNLLLVILFHGGLNGFNSIFERELFPELVDVDAFVIFYILSSLIFGTIAYFRLSQFSADHLFKE